MMRDYTSLCPIAFTPMRTREPARGRPRGLWKKPLLSGLDRVPVRRREERADLVRRLVVEVRPALDHVVYHPRNVVEDRDAGPDELRVRDHICRPHRRRGL